MAQRIKVTTVDAVKMGSGITVDAAGVTIALFNVNGSFYAVNNTCPHRGGSLGMGFLEGTTISCPWHGWQFNVTDGISCFNPSAKISCYSVEISGNDIFVTI